jgi:hypothetical protein
MFDDKKVLIIRGTGSLGTALKELIIKEKLA